MIVLVIFINYVWVVGDLRVWFSCCVWVLREFKVCLCGYILLKFNNVVDFCSLLLVFLYGIELIVCIVVVSYFVN